MTRRWLPLFVATLMLLTAASHAIASEIWSGRVFGFSKSPFGNPALIQNQDRVTPTVWLTRANTHGLFNYALETVYTHALSPKNTEWATGDAINHAALSFKPWDVWNGLDPPASVGVNACLHIIDADIFIDIVFTSWGGSTSGGAFSYLRALPPAVPTLGTSWGRIKQLYH